MNKPIFTWKGAGVGYIAGDNIFDLNGQFLGWLEPEGKTVWRHDGKFVGFLDGNNIVRRTRGPAHMDKTPHFPLMLHMPHTPLMKRTAKMVRPGIADVWTDLLD